MLNFRKSRVNQKQGESKVAANIRRLRESCLHAQQVLLDRLSNAATVASILRVAFAAKLGRKRAKFACFCAVSSAQTKRASFAFASAFFHSSLQESAIEFADANVTFSRVRSWLCELSNSRSSFADRSIFLSATDLRRSRMAPFGE